MTTPAATANDRAVLAKTVWAECRGGGLIGMTAVGWAIRNRVDDHKDKSWWGEGYAGVCQAPWQFSCWNKNDPNYPYLGGTKAIPAAEYSVATKAASAVIDDIVVDPTGGATHYYAKSMKTPPAWAAKATFTVEITGHLFYKNVP